MSTDNTIPFPSQEPQQDNITPSPSQEPQQDNTIPFPAPKPQQVPSRTEQQYTLDLLDMAFEILLQYGIVAPKPGEVLRLAQVIATSRLTNVLGHMLGGGQPPQG